MNKWEKGKGCISVDNRRVFKTMADKARINDTISATTPAGGGPKSHDRIAHWFGGSFLACFLGLAATRVWLQCNLFASYTQSDDGLITIISNLAYGGLMLIVAIIALRRPEKAPSQKLVVWSSFVLMTLATLVLIAGKTSGSSSILLVGSILAGLGGAAGGALWVRPYLRLGVQQGIMYGFASLGLGSLGGFALALLPTIDAYFISMFMPAIALLCWKATLQTDTGSRARPKPCYDNEPTSTYVYIFGGIIVFGLALGISRGFPAGDPVPMSIGLRAVHQLGVVAISLFIIWLVGVRHHRLSFSLLWRIEIITATVGAFLLLVFPGTATDLAVAIVNIADTLMLGVLWVTLQDASRHTTMHPYAVYGFAWAARVLSRDLGRLLILLVGENTSQALNTALGVIMLALSASMVLLLSNNIPVKRPFFANDDVTTPKRDDAPTQPLDAHTVSAFQDQQERTQDWLGSEFDLSERELEVTWLIYQGRSKSVIADKLFLSENTVRTHAKKAYVKLGVHSKQDLIDLIEAHEQDESL